MADYLLSLPMAVFAYAHQEAIRTVYDGDEATWKRDEQRVDGSHPKDKHIACRYYLYYEVYQNTINGLVVEATLPRKEDSS